MADPYKGRTSLQGLLRWALKFAPLPATKKERRPRGPGMTARQKRFQRDKRD